jgi:hypothetical protein
MAPCSLAQSQLKELLHYDPDTGVFTNLVRRNRQALIGCQAGYLTPAGYIIVSISRIKYQAHRLAWFYLHGIWPKNQLDHINRIKKDNRIINLREATVSENHQNIELQSNNTSGYKGISWRNDISKWEVRICLNRVQTTVGYFKFLPEAIVARKQAEEQLHSHRVVA